MYKKIIQSIVIGLSILILFAFIALIYGLYIKISVNSLEKDLTTNIYSLNLNQNEQIEDIKVINENQLLIIIKESNNKKGVIYNIKKNEVSKYIIN